MDLFEKFIKHGRDDVRFTVVRAVDPGLVHIYHPIVCDETLSEAQLIMCRGTRAASIAGGRAWARKLLNDPVLLNAGWNNPQVTTENSILQSSSTIPSPT